MDALSTDRPTDTGSYKGALSHQQVTRGHNIVADGWAGASNPQPHPNHTPNPSRTHLQTNKQYQLQNHKYAFFAFLTRAWQLERDQRTNGRTKPLIELRVRNLRNSKERVCPTGQRFVWTMSPRELSLASNMWHKESNGRTETWNKSESE